MLERLGHRGGNLIAMRPDKELAGLLGLTDAGATLSNAYLKVDTAAAPGAGIVAQTIQFHGPPTGTPSPARADRSRPCTPCLNRDREPGGDAASRRLERRSGRGLHLRPRALDRVHAPGQPGLGRPGARRRHARAIIRSNDLFFGAQAGDLQPDWVDLNKVAIPQADEQQRLLANLIEQMDRDKKPLPRFWYFPRGQKAVVVMTGDDHAQRRHAGRFDWDKAAARPAAAWPTGSASAARRTSIPAPRCPTRRPPAYDAQGFEIALHVNTNCANWTPASLEAFYASQLATFAAPIPELAAPSTNRTHCITWSDWATQPKVELDHGIRLDTNYYYWPGAWIQDRPGLLHRIGHADALRRPRRHADRRLPGGDPDDRRVRPRTRRTSTRCSTTRSAPQGYYGVVHRQHAHGQRQPPGSRRDRRVGAWRAACRSSRRGRC